MHASVRCSSAYSHVTHLVHIAHSFDNIQLMVERDIMDAAPVTTFETLWLQHGVSESVK